MHPIAFFDKKVVQKLEQTSSKVRAVVLLICFAIGIALMGIMRTQMQAPLATVSRAAVSPPRDLSPKPSSPSPFSSCVSPCSS